MTIFQRPERHHSAHAEFRSIERKISREAAYRAIDEGQMTRQGDGRLKFHGLDGIVVVTDSTAPVVITVLGRIDRAVHDRAGGGVSRHRRNRRGPGRPNTSNAKSGRRP